MQIIKPVDLPSNLGPVLSSKSPFNVMLDGFEKVDLRVLTEELPFVTLLLRVRGNSPVEQAALQRRREFDRIVTDLVRAAEDEGDVRPDVDPAVTSRLLFGTVNSLTEWYRPERGLDAAALADALVTTTFDGLRTA